MISKQIIHLKNVVIFKILIYFLVVIFFFFLFPALNSNLESSVSATKNAQIKLQDLENKIAFVNNSRDQIIESYNKYLAIQKSTFDFSCFLKQTLDKSYIKLASDIGLSTKPELYSSISPVTKKFNNTRNIEILITDLKSEFASKTIYESLSFIQQFYNILPEYSLIKTIDINMEEVITPESIGSLSPDVIPSLIKNKVDIEVRELHILPD